MPPVFPAKKRISKSTLSMYLRTKCDRELYLSLHKPQELEVHGMPAPLQARPGIGILQTAGQDFEAERNDQLINIFGSQVIFTPDKSNPKKPGTAPLATLLSQVSDSNSAIPAGRPRLG